MSQRIVLFGIDGVPFRLMEKYSDTGVMPNFKKLRERGIFTRMKSTIPEISSVSWSSIITGKNPGEHGVYGFTDLIPGTYSISFSNFHKIKTPTFWYVLPERKHILINIPQTYPAVELNGKMVSGFISPDISRSVYPTSLSKLLHTLSYEIDVDAMHAYESMPRFLDELFVVFFTKRIKTIGN